MCSSAQDRYMTKGRCAALVVGTDDWATDQAAGTLRRSGMTVLRCHEPGAPPFPCNAFIEGRVCPLDAGFDVVVTVRARSSRLAEPGEMGAICALRSGRPLVVAGVTSDSPFAGLATKTVQQGADVVHACFEAAGIEAESTGDGGVIDLRPVAP